MDEKAHFGLNPEERMQALNFISTVIDNTTELINTRFQDPEVIKKILNDVKEVKENEVTKFLLRRPSFSTCVGMLMAAVGASMIVAGGLACSLIGGLPVGVGMVAAGVALIFTGTKMYKLGGTIFATRHRRDNIFNNKLSLAELGDAVEKIAHCQKTQDVFAKCKQAVKAWGDFFNKRAGKVSHAEPRAEGIEMGSLSRLKR
ncbi:MAG: hypothetical protein K0S27_230 [Gammaproteobacteria bacterium]|nr:hypothetical protein [Gammaproteobacteria bacterium]